MQVLSNTESNSTKLFWSRIPGKFVNRSTGEELKTNSSSYPGTIRDWYETLVTTIMDAAARLETKTGYLTTELIAGPEASVLIEHLVSFRMHYVESMYDRNVEIKPMKLSDRKNVKLGILANRLNVTLDYNMPDDELHVKVLDPETMQTMDSATIKILDMTIL